MRNMPLAAPRRRITALLFACSAMGGNISLASDIADKVTGQLVFEDGQHYATLNQKAGEHHFVFTLGNARVSTVRQSCDAPGLRLCLKFDKALILIPETLTVGTSVQVDAAVAVKVKARIEKFDTPDGECSDLFILKATRHVQRSLQGQQPVQKFDLYWSEINGLLGFTTPDHPERIIYREHACQSSGSAQPE